MKFPNLLVKFSKLHLEKSFQVDMPISDLWESVTNTERVNRGVGMAPAQFTPIDIGRKSESRMFGISMVVKERPFEWVKDQFFQVERLLDDTPIAKFDGGSRLYPVGQQTQVTLYSDVQPRNPFGWLVALLTFHLRATPRQKRLYETIAQNYQQHSDEPFPLPGKPEVNEKRLTQALAKLPTNAGSPELVRRFINHLRSAHDDDVVKMRPYALADHWGVPRPEVVRLFLHATRAGLLDMEWNVLCPNCRVTKGNFARLSELSKMAHCDTCHIDFGLNFDEYVELRFTVNQQIREAIVSSFCIAGPFMTRHVLVQLRLQPGQRRQFALPLAPGQYRLRTRPENGRLNIKATALYSNDERPTEVVFRPEGVSIEEVEIDSQFGSFAVTNETPNDLLLILEQGAWGQQGLSAAEVTALQDFRDLFSSEVLTPGVGIEIRHLTFLFSDLKDSTAMYERTGDNPAYVLVRDHFAVLSKAIIDQQGALVKTIGDAVMAVFARPEGAVAACLEIQRLIVGLNAAQPEREKLVVKLGLHSGTSIAITANDILDYFGSTVNTAARVQGVSIGGDMVLTEAVYNYPGVAELLANLPHEEVEVKLKGLSQVFKLHRLWPVPEVWRPQEEAQSQKASLVV